MGITSITIQEKIEMHTRSAAKSLKTLEGKEGGILVT